MKNLITGILMLVFSLSGISVFGEDDNLHTDYDKLLKSYVKDGKVDYKKLKKNRKSLDLYLHTLGDIDKKDFDSWARDKRLAFLINLYNAATLQLIIDHYPVKSIKDIGNWMYGPWKQEVVPLFGKKITLDHLEHKIIRKEYKEPRIHMALVCAAKGCPPLRSEAYTAEKLDNQLNEQSKAYLSSSAGMRIDKDEKKVYLSSIFKWYGDDFSSVKAFAEKHSGIKLDDLSVSWLDYDWTLNDKN